MKQTTFFIVIAIGVLFLVFQPLIARYIPVSERNITNLQQFMKSGGLGGGLGMLMYMIGGVIIYCALVEQWIAAKAEKNINKKTKKQDES